MISNTNTSDADLAFRSQKLTEARDLLAASFDLLNDDISGPQWLGMLANLANCDAVTCIWWSANDPDKPLKESSAAEIDVSAERIRLFDQLISQAALTEPVLLDDLELPASLAPFGDNDPLFRPDQLIACVDWWPACVLIMFAERRIESDWIENDRQRLIELLPTIRKSIGVKKKLSSYADAIDLSQKILDEIPRGLLTLAPNCEVISANRFAHSLLKNAPLISLDGDTFVMSDRAINSELQEQMNKISSLPLHELNEFVWYKNLSGVAETGSITATLVAFPSDKPRAESSPRDRVAVLILEQLGIQGIPEAEQLEAFFQLTKAQSRLLRATMMNDSINDAAAAIHISVNTARSHLKAIYAKLGVKNKGQLLQLINATLTDNGHKKLR